MCEHLILVMGTLSRDLECSYCNRKMNEGSDGWVCLACATTACLDCGDRIRPSEASPVAILPVSAFSYPDPPNLE